jgi:hypothetical protein
MCLYYSRVLRSPLTVRGQEDKVPVCVAMRHGLVVTVVAVAIVAVMGCDRQLCVVVVVDRMASIVVVVAITAAELQSWWPKSSKYFYWLSWPTGKGAGCGRVEACTDPNNCLDAECE